MVSPYPQYPPSAPYGPGSLAPPPPPDAVKRATNLILAGAVLAVVYGVVDGLTAHNSTFYSYTSTPSGTTVHQANYLVSGIVGGVIQCLLWLWMAWKTKAGRNWARVLSTVFFGFMCLGLLIAIAAAASHSDALLALLVTLVEWGAGLAALIQLWRPESSQFFAAARQAKLATAFSPPYPGAPYPAAPYPGAAYPGVQYPGPGYPPPPQPGQPSADNGPQQPPS
jgi:hypothetical protein